MDKNIVYLEEIVPEKWKGYTFIMPAVAVGNVGQLAIDLVLSYLDAKLVGYIHHPSVLPLIGPDPFDAKSKNLVTSCQIYEAEDKKLLILQQRAPCVSGQAKLFEEFLVNWIKKLGFQMVITLSSCFSQFFSPDELSKSSMLFLCTSDVKPTLEPKFKDFSWSEFHMKSREFTTKEMSIPGGGRTKCLLEAFEANKIPFAVIISPCSEGNNYPEAINMANEVNKWLQLEKNPTWKMPISWSMPYGNDAASSIY